MLVLTIGLGKRFYISDNIEIKLISINGEQVRIGINAPKDIPIVREGIVKNVTSTCETAKDGKSSFNDNSDRQDNN